MAQMSVAQLTGSEIAQIIVALSTLFAALGALATSIVAAILSLQNSRKIEEVHLATNSMKDELVAATAKASKAEATERGEEKAATLAEGMRQGAAMGRAPAKTSAALTPGELPVPVTDERATEIARSGVEATERVAAAAEKANTISKKV